MKISLLALLSMLSLNSFACRMTESQMVSKTAIESVKTLNNVDEVLQTLSINKTDSQMIFTRDLVGSIVCVKRSLRFNIEANCKYTILEEEESFLKLTECGIN